MENPAATLYCSNNRCQAPNPQSNKFCQQCRTPLLRRYLWAIGQGIDAYKPGELLGGRYEVVRDRILLETKPSVPPETPQDIPQDLLPYLRLSPYGLHVPQLYGRVTLREGDPRSQIWLLEDAPIYSTGSFQGREATDTEGQLLPELATVWKDAPAIRQLNWLWQWANLWQPLRSEGVASSLLTPALLRVEGSIVRLWELQSDTNQTPTLQQLGQLWASQLLPGTSSVIAGFVQQLCPQLVGGQIRTAEDLVALLDRALKDYGRSQSRTYQIFTRTDAGPSRKHNEDACYPPTGQLIRPPSGASALAIVCDGIGGHAGGEVASQLAIDTLRERVEKLPTDPDNSNPTTLTLELERAACAANDMISSTNDRENRFDRQRMGTTLVMAQTCAHEIYITHVGDSRIYWVTKHGCHQVTQDDDLASREVRLGYSLYRNAVQQPTSGSLVQALGMAPSATLHPTVQRFVLDEDCVFLLCSDGLSDSDRVEQHWQTEILPILEGRIDLPTAGARLIQIANTQNGHDNATVALLYCKVTSSKETGRTQLSVAQPESIPNTVASLAPTTVMGAAPSAMKTQQLPTPRSTRHPWGLLLGIVVLLGLGGVLAYLLIPGVSEQVNPLVKQISSNSDSSPTPSPSAEPTSSETPALAAPGAIQIARSTLKNSEGKDVPLLLRRELPPQDQLVVGFVPAGSVLQVVNRSPDRQWLELKVCSSGNADAQQPKPAKGSPGSQSQAGKSPGGANAKPPSAPYRQVKRGDTGWMREADVLPLQNPNFTPTATQQSECTASTPSPAASPSP